MRLSACTAAEDAGMPAQTVCMAGAPGRQHSLGQGGGNRWQSATPSEAEEPVRLVDRCRGGMPEEATTSGGSPTAAAAGTGSREVA